MRDTDVAIVGAGPTGLALAAELALAGVSCRVLERRTDEPNITRAFAVHARTLELLDARGLADDLVARGLRVERVQPAAGATLHLSILDSRYPMVLIVPQSGTERLLEARARDLGVEITRGAEVTGLAQDGDEVRLSVAGHGVVTSRYAVGTDGAHSAVRRLVGVDFVGKQYETHIVLADVRLARPPDDPLFGRNSADGLALVVPFGDGWQRLILWDRRREHVPLDEPVTLAELVDGYRRIAGDDFGMGEPRWRSRFLSERRQARDYRVGRVFLAGDAAHVHSPAGGQGMNTGIQDAMNLGWKLAAELQGWAAPGLLDSYQAERHPVGAQVLQLTDALISLALPRSRVGAAVRRAAIRTILRLPPAQRRIAGRIAGTAIRYARPAGAHRWVGRRAPDDPRVYTALRAGKFVLTGHSVDWSDRVVALPDVTVHHGPSALLVRPDGYVAWASDRRDDPGVGDPLRRWCGPERG